MAQHDYVIDNQSSASARSDLNSLFQAIASQNSGATAPTTTYANMIWYDTANDLLKMRNEANSGWITLGTVDQANNVFNPNFLPATQAEAQAGTNNVKGMTPLRVAQAIAALVPDGTTVDYQVFTATGTWTKPSGISANAIVFVEMWGAGGGGGMTGSSTDNSGGGGGGGGYFSLFKLASSLGSTVSVTVGSGGAGATGAGGTGGTGGNSSFGSIATAYGGTGGTSTSGGGSTSNGGNGAGIDGNYSGATFQGLGYRDLSTNVAGSRGIFWGGGGAGAGNGSANGSEFGGGGGGGGQRRGSGGATVLNAGGISLVGGSGGDGYYTPNNTAGGNGTAPAGGGASGVNATGGSGARGEVRVWTIG